MQRNQHARERLIAMWLEISRKLRDICYGGFDRFAVSSSLRNDIINSTDTPTQTVYRILYIITSGSPRRNAIGRCLTVVTHARTPCRRVVNVLFDNSALDLRNTLKKLKGGRSSFVDSARRNPSFSCCKLR